MLCLIVLAAPSASAREVAVTYTADLLRNASGGLATGNRYLDNLDVEIRLDLERGGREFGTLLMHGLYNNGTGFSGDLVGDAQVVSNIEADEAWRLYQLWYEFGDRAWSVRAGLYDLNSEFDVNETGSLFLNSSHGIGIDLGQTGRNGPGIFPVSALALRGALRTGPGTARVAVLDAVPGDPDDAASNRIDLDSEEGTLTILEYDAPLGDSGRFWTGYWSYSATFENVAGHGHFGDNRGWYAGTERRFALAGRPAAWFLRYGEANCELNVFADYLGAGLAVDGLFSGRPDDRLGLAVASAGTGWHWREHMAAGDIATRRRETTWELTYLARITGRLSLQPDIQYVHGPSALRDMSDALIVGIRVALAY